MAEALVSSLVEQLSSILLREREQEVRFMASVEGVVYKLTSTLTAIQAVLPHAERRHVTEDAVRDWLEMVKDLGYDIEDVLDKWEAAVLSSQTKPGDDPSYAQGKVCSFLCSPCFLCKQVGRRRNIAKKITELNKRLDDVDQKKERFHFVPREENPKIERPMATSLIDIQGVIGRENDIRGLVKMLLRGPSDSYGSHLRVISIIGIEGIGKTTLAKSVFNHDSVNAYFDMIIWVTVSDPFDETRIAKEILSSLLGNTPSATELEDLLQNISKSIEKKKFLLVLDDVREENYEKWCLLKQSLEFGLSGSQVLVTTRQENVALVMDCSKDDILKVGALSDEECWSILNKIALFDRNAEECNSLKDIGKEISKKCRGVPLIAKSLGSILQFKKTREQWQNILESEIWELKEARIDVFVLLLFSYEDMSPALKRCFSYCAIFPKDYEIWKSELIELWMAQGYLNQRQSDNLEIIGEHYFQELAMESFFQDFKKNEFDDQSIYSCKMSDMGHNLAQIITRNECHSVEEGGLMDSIMGSTSWKVRHLCLTPSSCTPSPNTFKGLTKMRSLLFFQSGSRLPLTTADLSSLFPELTHVRSLSLRYGDFAEIPSSICKLVQLRWLDLSYNVELKLLPETLCDLHNLQTIDVSWCRDLELPRGMGQLINLRRLRNYGGPSRLPKGIARLIGLRTLETVDVGCDSDAVALGYLKNLKQLGGRLSIKNLGAYKGHVGEAKQAELKEKEQITTLELQFSSRGVKEEEQSLLEALEPSANLKILTISKYGGTTFPGWMISLSNLRDVRLLHCYNCEHLPSLGKLPSLETLGLSVMDGVKKVGLELLGIEAQIGDSKSEISASTTSSSSSSLAAVAFPKLKNLHFSEMHCWEDWDDYYDGTAKPPANVMPSLRFLRLSLCHKLKSLPDYILQNTMLDMLEMDRSDLLSKRYNKEDGEDRSKISHITNVRIYTRAETKIKGWVKLP